VEKKATNDAFGKQFAHSHLINPETSMWDAVGSSSSVAGGLVYGHQLSTSSIITPKLLKMVLPANLATWAATNGDGYDISAGWNAGGNIEGLADSGTVALVDGGMTDLTGVGWAVASGAPTVVMFSSGSAFDDVPYLFHDALPFQPMLKAGDGTGSNPMAWYGSLFEPIGEFGDVAEAMNKVTTALELAEGAHVLRLDIGGPLTLTTRDNPWYGIRAGRQVDLYYIGALQDLSSGGGESFYAYDAAVQQLVSTLLDPRNRAPMDKLIDALKGAMPIGGD